MAEQIGRHKPLYLGKLDIQNRRWVEEEGNIHHMRVTPLFMDAVDSHLYQSYLHKNNVIYAKLQEYNETQPGWVNSHVEKKVDDTGVDEFYFMFNGSLEVQNGNDKRTLISQVNYRNVLEDAEYHIVRDLKDNYFVSFHSPTGQVVDIPGYRISAGEVHNTNSIPGKAATFLAVKIKRPVM